VPISRFGHGGSIERATSVQTGPVGGAPARNERTVRRSGCPGPACPRVGHVDVDRRTSFGPALQERMVNPRHRRWGTAYRRERVFQQVCWGQVLRDATPPPAGGSGAAWATRSQPGHPLALRDADTRHRPSLGESRRPRPSTSAPNAIFATWASDVAPTATSSPEVWAPGRRARTAMNRLPSATSSPPPNP
jgi:hypothetical protein